MFFTIIGAIKHAIKETAKQALKSYPLYTGNQIVTEINDTENEEGMSLRGLEVLKQLEGFRTQAYQDSGGIWTIGYGSTFYKDGRAVKKGDVISHEEATYLLKEVVDDFYRAIKDSITTPLHQWELDAILMLTYNIGISAFRNSTLLKQINRGDFEAAANQFVRKENGEWAGWVFVNKKPILVNRRMTEKKIFLQGYDA